MKKFDYRVVKVGAIETNCVLLKCTETGKGIIFDPGESAKKIEKEIVKFGMEPVLIVNTHAHGDHIGAVNELKDKYKIDFLIHEKEVEYCEEPTKNMSIHMGAPVVVKPEKTLKDGDTVEAGNMKLKVIHTPGHTLGSSCFLIGDLLIAGDTIFAGSVGRTDLYGGDTPTIIRSVKTKIITLDDKTVIIPGHGPMTTVKNEKMFNPFVK